MKKPQIKIFSILYIHIIVIQKNRNLVTSNVNYGSQKICSSIQSSNIIGTQFHPEKSGSEGIKFLKKLKRFV